MRVMLISISRVHGKETLTFHVFVDDEVIIMEVDGKELRRRLKRKEDLLMRELKIDEIKGEIKAYFEGRIKERELHDFDFRKLIGEEIK